MTRLLRCLTLAGLLAGGTLSATPQDEAAALIAKNQFLAAERIIEPLASVKKPDARTLYLLSQIRLGQGQPDEAIKFAERAIKLDGSRAEYFSQLGKAYGQQLADSPNDFVREKIRKALEQSLKLDPNHLPGLLGLSSFHSMSANFDKASLRKALEYANRAARVDPFEGEQELGRIELQFRQLPEALAHFEKAIALKPENALVRVSAAMVLGQMGRKDEARASLLTALKLNPSLKEARSALELLDQADPAKP